MKFIIYMIFVVSILEASFNGMLIDRTSKKPIKDAIVSDSVQIVKSDDNGSFSINSKEKIYHVKAIGYKPFSFNDDYNTSIIKLEPITVRALYLTFWGASNNAKTFKKLLDILDKTQANAIVVDVKNEYGSTLFWTRFKQANSYGAHKQRTNRDIKRFIKTLKEKGIYTIARVVTFKDEIQARHNFDYAIKKNDANKTTIWRNHDNMAWVDPFDKRSHRYTIEIAKEAARVGFDEINFDYIRFPAKRKLMFCQNNTQKNRVKAIEDFLKEANKALLKYGVFISVNTYGNVCWTKDGDNGIGQTINSLKSHCDYIAPMLYPSGFANGSFNFKHPASHPYEVIYRSIKHIKPLISSKKVRPWLQHFRDYTKKKPYKKEEIQAQIKATQDANTSGWMLWSPSSKYFIEYLN